MEYIMDLLLIMLACVFVGAVLGYGIGRAKNRQ